MTPREQQAVDSIRSAIADPGPRPDIHRLIITRHRREWPTLWAAIDELMAATKLPPGAIRATIHVENPRCPRCGQEL